jgi:WD40 repeat protein
MLFSSDNKYLATLGSDGIIVSSVGRAPETVDRIPNHDIKAMTFSSDNDTLIYLTDDFEVYEAAIDGNPEEGTPLGKIVNNAKAVCASALSYDGGKVALQIDNKIILWNRESPTSVLNLMEINISNPCTPGTETLTFSPDAILLAVADGSHIHLFDTQSDTETELNVSSTTKSITKIKFVDGETIAVQSAPVEENTSTVISLWNINARAKIDQLFYGDLDGLVSNGSILFYRDPNGQVVLRDLNADQDMTSFDEKRNFLCGIVSGRQVSESEWQQFFPNEEYAPNSICTSTTTP